VAGNAPHEATGGARVERPVGGRYGLPSPAGPARTHVGSPMRTPATRFATLIALALPACGSDGGADPDGGHTPGVKLPKASLTVQERLDVEAFQSEAAADP